MTFGCHEIFSIARFHLGAAGEVIKSHQAGDGPQETFNRGASNVAFAITNQAWVNKDR